jgi:hypothetical protein
LEWSFGQLLALATWIPVSVEWVTFWYVSLQLISWHITLKLRQSQLVWREVWRVTCHKVTVGNILRILHETGDTIDPMPRN